MAEAQRYRRWCVTCRRSVFVSAPGAECPHGEPAAVVSGGPVRAVYSDGGVIGKNPSATGGTWAWCHVGELGGRLSSSSGAVTPADVGLDEVSNNVTELVAMLYALEALPAGWSGPAFTDSDITRLRFSRPHKAKFNGVPARLVERVRAAVGRLGAVQFHLLGGHPSRAELAAGRNSKGVPVSVHNVWADAACTEAAAAFARSARMAGV